MIGHEKAEDSSTSNSHNHKPTIVAFPGMAQIMFGYGEVSI